MGLKVVEKPNIGDITQGPPMKIAPAGNDTVSPSTSSPQAISLPVAPRKGKLSVSKKWVLPPRPKPGRKPKPKVAKAEETVPLAIAPASEAKNNKVHKSAAHSHREVSNEGEVNGDDDGCGLCERENGCLCSDIGIKSTDSSNNRKDDSVALAPLEPNLSAKPPKTHRHLPQLKYILDNAVVQPSIPLRRSSPSVSDQNLLSESNLKRFRRAPTVNEQQPTPPLQVVTSSMVVDPPTKGLPLDLSKPEDKCGFCTDNTPCLCAETASQPLPTSETIPSHNLDNGLRLTSAPVAPAVAPAAPAAPSAPSSMHSTQEDPVASCDECQKSAMSMLFCLSLGSSAPLVQGAVAIPCHKAYQTLQKHPRFDFCDLGKLVLELEVGPDKMVGVQSINRALQQMSKNQLDL